MTTFKCLNRGAALEEAWDKGLGQATSTKSEMGRMDREPVFAFTLESI